MSATSRICHIGDIDQADHSKIVWSAYTLIFEDTFYPSEVIEVSGGGTN